MQLPWQYPTNLTVIKCILEFKFKFTTTLTYVWQSLRVEAAESAGLSHGDPSYRLGFGACIKYK